MRNAAPWTVQLDRTAEKHLDRLPPHDSEAVVEALRALARDPFSNPNAQRLRHHVFSWRLRVRAYRVLYDLDVIERLILVASVERRSSTTYRKR